MTYEEIDAARTRAGGWTKAQLAAWGISWPPAKGWRRRLVEGPDRPLPLQYLLQAQCSGYLAGDELKALAECAPRFVRMLCEGLNITRADLQHMANERRLTIAAIGKAMS